MSFRNISAWAIRNPIVPIVFFIGLTLAGLVSFGRMDVNDKPNIDFPAVVVQVSQPGAAPTEIETQITQKIEAAVRSVNGVDEIQSQAREGSSQTTVQFQIGIDSDDAVNEVKNAVDQVRGDLPDGILEPRVTKIEVGGNGPIGYFAVSADNMTMEQLSWFIDDTVSRRLLSIEGMATVSRAGGVNREIRVILDPARMQSLGVTASAVNQALRQVNTDTAGGVAEIAGSRQSVRVLGNADTALQLANTRISLGGGRTIRLDQVGTVSDGFSEQTSIAKLGGRQVVTFGIERAKEASDVTVYDAAVAEMKKIEADNPGLHITQLYTSVDYTKQQYESSISAMVEGSILAVIVVFLFLRDWRATVIAALAIPLSAIPTFWFMDLLGFTLNQLSLLALSLVAGVLVDDAIVEIENIVRHMRMGKSAYQASIDAADEIGLAVVATSLSIVAVFLPVGLMPGISGQFFKNFGLTVVAAVIMSLAVARLITPMVAAYFLHAKGHASHGEGRLMDGYMKVLAWTLDSSAFERARARIGWVGTSRWFHVMAFVVGAVVLGGMAWAMGAFGGAAANSGTGGAEQGGGARWYMILLGLLACYLVGGVLNLVIGLILGYFQGYESSRFTARARYIGVRFLDHRAWMFGAGVLALVLTATLLMTLPQQFQPTSDEDTVQLGIEMVPGTTVQQTEAVADRVTKVIERQPEVERVLQRNGEGNGRLFIVLKEDRTTPSYDFTRRVTPELQKIPDARVTFQSQNGGGGGGGGRDISIMLTGSDPEILRQTAVALVDQMAALPAVVAPRIAADLKRPELIIQPRFDLAAQLGVTTTALSQAIRIATLGEIDQNAAKFSLSDRQVPIRVVLSKSARQDISTIENLPVPSTVGGSVPLKRVAEIKFGAGPTQIQRFNQSRRIMVTADLGPGQIKGPVTKQINALPIMRKLPAGVSNRPVGDEKWQGELISNFIIAVISGVLMVFAVLVLLYRRFVSPLVNMTSLLLAPLGGLLALLILGQPLSISVYIGLLMLLGIVAKNSILLIDFAIEEMEHGVPKKQAITDAGHKRAQPILMTTVAMVAGMIPTAISLSGDSAWRAPMGTTVIGGLLLSTMLTLVIVPAGFSLADGVEKRLGPWLRTRILTYRPEHKLPEAYPAE
ncbi:MAG: efflux RND transporter permease subunit [Croceibacterium sp.]